MARTSRRTPKEIKQLLRGYEQSGLSRRQYCEEQGVAVTTLDYYRQRQLKDKKPRTEQQTAALVRVKLTAGAPPAQRQVQEGFSVVVSQGRRIESPWNFSERGLARLIRVLEAV